MCDVGWLGGCMVFGLFLGKVVINFCANHSILVVKSCGGG